MVKPSLLLHAICIVLSSKWRIPAPLAVSRRWPGTAASWSARPPPGCLRLPQRAKARRGPRPLHLPGRTEFARHQGFPFGKTLVRRKAPPRSAGPLRKRPIPSLLTCLIQLFHSQRVLRLGACACPSGPRPAGGPGPFICPGELNSPGIKVFPSGKRLYGAKRRPAPRVPCESAPSPHF